MLTLRYTRLVLFDTQVFCRMIYISDTSVKNDSCVQVVNEIDCRVIMLINCMAMVSFWIQCINLLPLFANESFISRTRLFATMKFNTKMNKKKIVQAEFIINEMLFIKKMPKYTKSQFRPLPLSKKSGRAEHYIF